MCHVWWREAEEGKGDVQPKGHFRKGGKGSENFSAGGGKKNWGTGGKMTPRRKRATATGKKKGRLGGEGIGRSGLTTMMGKKDGGGGGRGKTASGKWIT